MPHHGCSVNTELCGQFIDCFACKSSFDQLQDLLLSKSDLTLFDVANTRPLDGSEVIQPCFFDVALVRVLSG